MKMHQFVSFNNFSRQLECIFIPIWALVYKFNGLQIIQEMLATWPDVECPAPQISSTCWKEIYFPPGSNEPTLKTHTYALWSIIFIMLTDIHHTILYRTLTSWNLYVLHCATLNIVPIFKSIISVQEKLKTYCFTHSKCLSNFSNLGTYINTGTNHVITGK